jgi:pimeloyl-ACP methyl ester carboxylesterase
MADPWYTVEGDASAPMLLCLHGIGSAAAAFEPQYPLASSTHRRLVAWDAPGYRHSTDPDHPYTLDDWADAAAGLIERQGRGPDGAASADVLGVSWGGVTATRLALRHPHLVRTLILADSSVGSGTSQRQAETMRSRAAAIDELGLEAFAASRSPLLVTTDAPHHLIDEVARLMVDSVRQPGYTLACASLADTDHRSDLASITAPTLVIVGDQDRVTPPASSQELVDGIPGARLVSIEGAGHLANQECPDQFNEAVETFLKEQG